MRPDDFSGHGCSSPAICTGLPFRRRAPAWRLAKTIAGRTPTGHSYSVAFHQVEFRMPLKSDTVEAASRTLLLLEELNRHRVTSIDCLHKATGLPKSTVVRLMKR